MRIMRATCRMYHRRAIGRRQRPSHTNGCDGDWASGLTRQDKTPAHCPPRSAEAQMSPLSDPDTMVGSTACSSHLTALPCYLDMRRSSWWVCSNTPLELNEKKVGDRERGERVSFEGAISVLRSASFLAHIFALPGNAPPADPLHSSGTAPTYQIPGALRRRAMLSRRARVRRPCKNKS